jgi:hypothetical protein
LKSSSHDGNSELFTRKQAKIMLAICDKFRRI